MSYLYGYGGGTGSPGRGASSWGEEKRSRVKGYTGSAESIAEGKPTRTLIRDLSPHQPNTLLIGIVVNKQSIHSFPDKKNPGSERFKFTFTLRDSPSDYINITCWGSEAYIRKTFGSFRISDNVEVTNGQIISKTGGEDRWNPWTPSQYQINASEIHTSISLYNGWDYTELTALVHAPIRPTTDYHPLSDFITNGQALDGSHVNIMAIIKNLGTPKQMISRSGKPLRKCEVRLMDQTCASFSLQIWDDELIELAQTWTPRENIIFAVDVKVAFDSFRNSMVGSCTQRTIVTTNPDCREAHQLYQFAQSLSAEAYTQEEDTDGKGDSSDVQSISEVYTVEGLLQEQRDKPNSFSGILFAFLTILDIDQATTSAVCYRCTTCKFRADEGAALCQNKSCSSQTFACEPHYNLLVSFSDYTCGIDGVRLTGQAAADLLQCSPQEFLSLSESHKMELKCSLLLERFKVYFKSGVFIPDQRKPVVRVLSMALADPVEMGTHLRV